MIAAMMLAFVALGFIIGASTALGAIELTSTPLAGHRWLSYASAAASGTAISYLMYDLAAVL